MEANYELLSALIDGEPVDPEELVQTLKLHGAHEALVDFVRLRAGLLEERSEPSPEFHRRIRSALGAPHRRAQRKVVRLAAIAAFLAIAIVSGMLISHREEEKPPTASRVLKFEMGVDWQPWPRIER